MGKAGGKAAAKVAEKRLLSLGYEFDRVNSHQWWVYTYARFAELTLNPAVSERDARHLVKKVERLHGIEQETNKRNAQVLKERRRVERERIRIEMDRLDAARAALIRRKELLPTGDFDQMARTQRLALEREIERIDRERREWLRLMTENEASS